MTGCSSWSWDEINAEWLLGNKLALPPEAIVEAFNRAEKALGREWIEAARMQSGRQIRGTWPTLHVATVGQLLASLEGASNAAELIEKLRGGDASAFAELTAVHLIRSKKQVQSLNSGQAQQ